MMSDISLADELLALLSIEEAYGILPKKPTLEQYPSFKLLRAWEKRCPPHDMEQILAAITPKVWEKLPPTTSMWAFEKQQQYPNAIKSDKLWNRNFSHFPLGSESIQLLYIEQLIKRGHQGDAFAFDNVLRNTRNFMGILNDPNHKQRFHDLMRLAAASQSAETRSMFNALPLSIRTHIDLQDPIVELQNTITRHVSDINRAPRLAQTIFVREIHPLLSKISVDMVDPQIANDIRFLFSHRLPPSQYQKTTDLLKKMGWSGDAIVQLICPYPQPSLLLNKETRSVFLNDWVTHHPKKLQDTVDENMKVLPTSIDHINQFKMLWQDLSKTEYDAAFFDKRYHRKEMALNWHFSLANNKWKNVARAIDSVINNPKVQAVFPKRLWASYVLLSELQHGRPLSMSDAAPFAWPKNDRMNSAERYLPYVSNVERATEMYDLQERHVAHHAGRALHVAVTKKAPVASTAQKKRKM